MKAMPPAPPPLPTDSADSPAIEPSGARFAKPTDESAPFCVLVVEDQASVRTSLVSELLHAGVTRVLEAADGPSALVLFREQRPDLVLLDIRLPGEDGYWVARQLREAEPGEWTPVIFLSGLDNDLDVWRGIEAGGDDYLVKPVKPIVLVAKLRAMRRLLDMRRRLVSLSAELHEANQKLNEMVELDQLTGLVNRRGFDRILHAEIASASREQSTGIEQVGHAVTDMDRVTQQNAALVEQSSAATQVLQQESEKPSRLTASFKL